MFFFYCTDVLYCILLLLGADIIGVNCRFDPNISLQTIGLMKEALDKEGLKVHLMTQPVGYHNPDAGRLGAAGLPEAPLGKFLFKMAAHFYIKLNKHRISKDTLNTNKDGI